MGERGEERRGGTWQEGRELEERVAGDWGGRGLQGTGAGRKKQHNEKERRCRVRERARAARGR
jgi:hypothetical protein